MENTHKDLWEKVGKKIKANRKLYKFTQEGLADEVTKRSGYLITRQQIGRWEKGTPIVHLENLTALCEIFDCSVAYLLCDYNAKMLKMENITEETGLTPEAVDNLIMGKNFGWPDIISALAGNDALLNAISLYIYTNDNEFNAYNHKLHDDNFMLYKLSDAELEKLRLDILYDAFRDFIKDLKTKLQ